MTDKPPTRLGTPPMVDGRPAFAGRAMVKKLLGLDTWDLDRLHREPGSLQTLARMIAHQARQLDHVDEQLRRNALSAIERLTAVASGERREIQSHGILRILGSDIETLSARYDQMADLLELGAADYRLAVVELAEAAEPTVSRVRGRAAAANSRTSVPPSADTTIPAPQTPSPPGAARSR